MTVSDLDDATTFTDSVTGATWTVNGSNVKLVIWSVLEGYIKVERIL